MRQLTTFSRRCSSLMRQMALLPGFFLLFFGAANGLASQTVHALKLVYAVRVDNRYPALVSGSPARYFYYLGDHAPSWLEAFPFLNQLRANVQNYGQLIDYVPYGDFGVDGNGYVKYPYFYRPSGSINAGQVPDDWTQDDIDEINRSYSGLSGPEKDALKGTIICGNTSNSEETGKFIQFNHHPIGTATGTGGVYAYDQDGNVITSFPGGSGYAVGYKPNADGSYTPVYYHIDGNTITESSSVPTSDFSTLEVDPETGNYSLSVPDYSAKLDTIIARIDNIDLQIPEINPEVTVNVPPPEVTVNPEITVNPDVTVNVPAPEVNVTIPDSISSSLDEISSKLDDIADNTDPGTGATPQPGQIADLEPSSEESALVEQFVGWQTNIPYIGDALDFGFNTLLGKLPAVGTDYVWLDVEVSPASKSRSRGGVPSWGSILSGLRVRVDFTEQASLLRAIRGVFILIEAICFVILCWRTYFEGLQS